MARSKKATSKRVKLVLALAKFAGRIALRVVTSRKVLGLIKLTPQGRVASLAVTGVKAVNPKRSAAILRHAANLLDTADDAMSSLPGPAKNGNKVIMSKVSGTTFKNRDGTDRQSTIRRLVKPGMPLLCKREPLHPKDPNAVALLLQTSKGPRQLGYVTSRIAGEVAKHLDGGHTVGVVVEQVTGGGEGETLGVNLRVTLYEPTA